MVEESISEFEGCPIEVTPVETVIGKKGSVCICGVCEVNGASIN